MSHPVFDTHFHIYDTAQLDLPWLKDVPQLKQAYSLADYQQACTDIDIKQLTYVEVDVAKDDNLTREASWITELATQDNLIRSVVLGADLLQDNFVETFTPWLEKQPVVGVRHGGMGFTSGEVYLSSAFVNNCQQLGKMGLLCETLARVTHMAQVRQLIEQCPNTQFVIDHCGSLSPAETNPAVIEHWQTELQLTAQLPNVSCKISGLLQSLPNAQWQAKDLAPIVNFCLDTFGEDRVVFASNWPVCNLSGSLQRWYHALCEIVATRPGSLKEKLFYQNAMRLYV
jgi:L-fuconolactonase